MLKNKPIYVADEFADLTEVTDWINAKAADGYELTQFISGVFDYAEPNEEGVVSEYYSSYYTAMMKLAPPPDNELNARVTRLEEQVNQIISLVSITSQR